MLERTDDERYIDDFLAQVENRDLEFKRAENSFDWNKALAYCAGIANSGGGYLILGVTDDRTVHGTAAFSDPRQLELRVHEKLSLAIAIREFLYEGKRVLVIQIPKRRRGTPVSFDGRYYLRVGESLVDMSAHQLGAIFDELRERAGLIVVTDHLTAAEVEGLLHLDTYFRLLEVPRPAQLVDALAVLTAKHLLVCNDSGTYGITATGALFLAHDLARHGLSWRRIRLIRYAATDRVNAVFEHLDSRGYGLCFEDILDLVRAHVPVVEIIEDGLRQVQPIYPGTAIREFLANALVHQDLDEQGVQITVEIFEDRVEIRNPGKPLIDVKRFVDETRSRNPELAEILRLANICEVRGSGVDRALIAIEDLIRPAPNFTAGESATTIVLHKERGFDEMNLDERVWAAFLHASVRHAGSSSLTNSSLRARFGLPDSKAAVVSQAIAAAVEYNLLKLDPRSGASRRHARYLPYFA
ncbi:ATP-binding protein [Microbacterium sp. NPDC090007]|uniref:ATP-binding protein n=1 Tax=Microbacterium sp. NPDC090007 TaxID=3364204 RepID=UPI00382865E0